MARRIIILLTVLIIVPNLMLVAFVFLGPKSPPTKPLPNPNGYDDFVKAGQLLSGTNSSLQLVSSAQIVAMVNSNAVRSNQLYYSDRMTKAELTLFITGKEEALSLIRKGLAKECLVPVEYTSASTSNLFLQVFSFKQAEQLLLAEGRLAESNGLLGDALNFTWMAFVLVRNVVAEDC